MWLISYVNEIRVSTAKTRPTIMLNANMFERKKYPDALGFCYKWVHCKRDAKTVFLVVTTCQLEGEYRQLSGSCWLTITLSTLLMEDEGPSVMPVPCYQSTWHHTSQKIVILMVTAMRIPTSVIFWRFAVRQYQNQETWVIKKTARGYNV
jgi:hypothetical protein